MKEWNETTNTPRLRRTVDQRFESFVHMVNDLHGRLKDKEVTHIATCSYSILVLLVFSSPEHEVLSELL